MWPCGETGVASDDEAKGTVEAVGTMEAEAEAEAEIGAVGLGRVFAYQARSVGSEKFQFTPPPSPTSLALGSSQPRAALSCRLL